ncbi:o-succinylbenzoate synthase [Castellaniella sp. GW247-6E4]|uniref:o-succinylbenzoate synthase n=1 Tax=Castellaniella sp. GW247-6E4 TaxID=3140380 RepID=UPI003315366F
MMRIEELEVFRIGMPLKAPFRSALGEERIVETIFLRLRWGGVEGWGEVTPQARPSYSPEWAAGVFRVIRDCLGPLLAGRPIGSGQDIQSMLSGVRGNYFAKAAIDIAWWDAYARSRGEPAWKVLGGSEPEAMVGADIPLQADTDALVEAVGQAVDEGYRRLKLKVTREAPERQLAAVRAAFPDIVIHVDCNGAFSLDDLPRIRALDHFDLAMLEQPLAFDDLVDHAALQKHLDVGICLDESITSAARARKAIEIGACRWINIKAGRVGGVTEALAIHGLCEKAGMPVWIGSMLESNLGQAVSLALATLPNVQYGSDIFPHGTFYATDICEPEMRLSGPSSMRAGDDPGFGWQPDISMLRAHLIERASVSMKSEGWAS